MRPFRRRAGQGNPTLSGQLDPADSDIIRDGMEKIADPLGFGLHGAGLRAYDRAGRRIETKEACRLLSDPGYVRVAYDDILTPKEHYQVLTIWRGFDASILGIPQVFETMVFGNGVYNGHGEKYTLLIQAEEGHKNIVEMIRDGKEMS